MQADTFSLTTSDGVELYVNRWLPEGAPKAVVQIAHGMAEHSSRYARFAQRLTDASYAVYANDHRGHGATTSDPRDHGYFSDSHGFDTVVTDMHVLSERIREEHPGVPFFLFGHSMGSFLSRSYAARFGRELDGLILSGTAGDPGLLGKVGQGVASPRGQAPRDGGTRVRCWTS